MICQWLLDADAAEAFRTEAPVVTVHCARGDGLLDEPWIECGPWIASIGHVAVRYEISTER